MKMFTALYRIGGKIAKAAQEPHRKNLIFAAIELEKVNQQAKKDDIESQLIGKLKELVQSPNKERAQAIVLECAELERELDEADFTVKAVEKLKNRLEGDAPEDLDIEDEDK